jgi:outer membrane lipoprotein carrier protein
MNRKNKKVLVAKSLIFLFCFFCFLPHTVCHAAPSADDEITAIQKSYEGIKDIAGSFVQKSYIRDLKRTDTFKGRFYIKRPMKLKWEYTGENGQEVFINGDEIIIYQKKDKQAFKGTFNRDTYGQAPIALLSGFGNIREEFTASEKNGRIVLKPRKPMGNIVSIEIEPSHDEFPIKSFTINDSHYNKIEMTLNDVKINTGLEDKMFRLSLPKDVKVYDYKP